MKKNRFSVWLYSGLALLFSAAAIAAAVFCQDTVPVLAAAPEAASQRAEQLMEAICRGDFSEAEELLYGRPMLGMDREPEDPVGAMIWEAYIRSLDYELVGELYATQQGIAQDVKLISLELESASRHLGRRARTLLNERIAQAEDTAELYDANNEFREELVEEVLQEAARQALEEDLLYTYQILSLSLVYSEEAWWVIADQPFLNAISGGITG